MKKLLLILLLLWPSLAQAEWITRPDCGTFTAAVNDSTVCLQTTAASGRLAGHFYLFTGSAWVDKTGGAGGGGSGDALVANPLSQFAATTSAQLAATITNETGTGALVFGTSPTLTTPILTTPTIASFASATHSHQNAAGGGNLDAAAIASGIFPPARLGTGSGGAAKFLREDGSFQNIPGGGDALTSSPLSQFAPTSSAQVAATLTDETGTGNMVFHTSPTLITPNIASFANATHTHQSAAGGGTLVATSVFASGTVPTARLGSGTANSTTFLRGDQTWGTPAGAGDVIGPSSATDNAIVRMDGTTGKLLQNSSALISDTGQPTFGDCSTNCLTFDTSAVTGSKTLTVSNNAGTIALIPAAVGAAATKKVVCVDTTTGLLYASSTTTDCSN